MILRIWTTGIDEARAEEYEDFARERSRPMFARQPGFVGMTLARSGRRRLVLTWWRDLAAAQALADADDYAATVAAIGETGFLRPPQTVELFEVTGDDDRRWPA